MTGSQNRNQSIFKTQKQTILSYKLFKINNEILNTFNAKYYLFIFTVIWCPYFTQRYRYQSQNDSIVATHEQVQSISNMARYSNALNNMLQQ